MRAGKILRLTPLILFAAFIWIYSLCDMLSPSRAYSELENRYLTMLPAPSVRAVFDNSYTLKYEEFTNDQFLMRDTWITLKSVCETALGKLENNGIVYGADDYMFEKLTAVDTQQLERNIQALARMREQYPDERIIFTLIPGSDAVLSDKLPRGLQQIDQLSMIGEIHDRLSDAGIVVLDASVLEEHTDEYIYYRTDHHWTTLGAYYMCQEFVGAMGAAGDLSMPQGSEVPDFYGTYFSKAKLFSARPDTITWYDIPASRVTINGEEQEGYYDLDMFEQRDKYAAFLRGNNGLTILESDLSENTWPDRPSRILLFKDSYGNSYAPWLLYGYDEVWVVDLRYYQDVEQLIQSETFDCIHVLYSFSNFTQDQNLFRLGLTTQTTDTEGDEQA